MVSIDQEKNETSHIFVLKKCYECEKQPIKNKIKRNKTNFTYVIARLRLLSGKKYKLVLLVSI